MVVAFRIGIGLSEVVVDQGELEPGLLEIRFHLLARFGRLLAIGFFGRRWRLRRQLGDLRLALLHRLLELALGLEQSRPGFAEDRFISWLVLIRQRFGPAKRLERATHQKVAPRGNGKRRVGMLGLLLEEFGQVFLRLLQQYLALLGVVGSAGGQFQTPRHLQVPHLADLGGKVGPVFQYLEVLDRHVAVAAIL